MGLAKNVAAVLWAASGHQRQSVILLFLPTGEIYLFLSFKHVNLLCRYVAYCLASNDAMISEHWMMWSKDVKACGSGIIAPEFFWCSWENHGTVGIPPEIWIGHISATSHKHYRLSQLTRYWVIGLFIYLLFINDAVSRSDYIRWLIGCLMNLKGYRRKRSWPIPTFAWRDEERHDSRCRSRNSNQTPSKYKSEALPLQGTMKWM
jgi:hypothetical protein